MEQQIKRIFYVMVDREINSMKEQGYYIKQISGTGTADYVWVLFEKTNNNSNTL